MEQSKMTNLKFYANVELALVVAAYQLWMERNDSCIDFTEWLNRKHDEVLEDNR